MPRIITLHEKLSVIDDWLSGESRNDIAIKHNIGSGTVYNIVEQWSKEIVDGQLANRLRELGIKLKKNGLTVSDCARGLRMLMMLKKYGIKDDESQEKVPYFLKEIYAKCQEVGLTAQQVFDYISDILKFSSEIYISEIPKFMKKKIEEKEELESVVEKLSKKINELSDIQEEKEQEIQRLSKIEETLTKTYRTFIISKSKLKQYGIEMDNIDLFVQSVVGIAKENHDPVQILAKIANYEILEKNFRYYNEEINFKKEDLARLNQDIDRLQKDLTHFKIKLEIIEELELRGFNIKELRTLYNMLNEIGRENDLTYDEIRNEFFKDVKNYEEVIGSRKEVDSLKNERKNLEVQIMKEREKYNSYPKIIESIIRLEGAGISEGDIIKIDEILSMTDYYLHKDNRLYKKALFDDLQKYRNLKLTIKKLEDIEINLKSTKKTQSKPPKKKTK
jgi:DNA repair exonuclease SbcCD ATPase subunit